MPEYQSQTSPLLFTAIVLAWPVVLLLMGAWKALFRPYCEPRQDS